MNVMYINGFGGQPLDNGPLPEPGTKKYYLNKLVSSFFHHGSVSNFTPDYTLSVDQQLSFFHSVYYESELIEIDLFIGTSMGGWLAQRLGEKYGIPFVSINPAVDPQKTLQRRIGDGETYGGEKYHLTEATVNSYDPMGHEGCGLILLDMEDEVIDSHATINTYNSSFKIHSFPGGNHRFQHWDESIELIKSFYINAELTYGLEDTDDDI